MPDEPALPQGIGESHRRIRPWHRHANPAMLIALATLLGLALAGTFGGGPHPVRVVETPAMRLSVNFPERLRNGEFFEMRAELTAKQEIGDAGLIIPASYWRDLTINAMIPAPAEEKPAPGGYQLSWGPLEAGETLIIKIDGQINPPLVGGTAGEIAVTDGERELARFPARLKVYP
ncbi:hypothetical protein GRI97_11475 [Altererythrobacter xixiisoli]|uniref:Uncharacterized protein n=1 Tax=Croceibacterium xixiisoli TaxID=1476466 RepID=A0A6I4TY85_9SPHN|nr:hypothetical protein [Croceibacterium xixiisoli]MXO99608.1 hypothetical protein [Croceibacterium xixiisoli]